MYLNRVFLDPHTKPPSQLRVVFEYIDFVMLIDINDDKAWPYPINIREFDSLGLEHINDPITLVTPEKNSKSEENRDRAYRAISILLEHYSELFDKKSRNRLIKKALEQTGEPRLYVTRQLRRYWQRGMSPDSLTPDYSNC